MPGTLEDKQKDVDPNNGYKIAAEDLWHNVIRNNFIVRPL
jgi:hypothetical protein